MARKTPGRKAARLSGAALAAFETAISSLNESNRLHTLEIEEAGTAAERAFDDYQTQLLRRRNAMVAIEQNDRVISNLEGLLA